MAVVKRLSFAAGDCTAGSRPARDRDDALALVCGSQGGQGERPARM